MAVVPDRQMQYRQKLETLRTNHQIVCDALKQVQLEYFLEYFLNIASSAIA